MNNPWDFVLNIGIILLVGLVLGGVLELSVRRVVKRMDKLGHEGERRDRLITLLKAGRNIGRVVILLVLMLMILKEFNVDITPVLASAGVVGLAFSLGAQTLIKDFLGGLLILLENQFTIGDTITVGDVSGTVEEIRMRATLLRDVEGKLVVIPNGDIRTVKNQTTYWAKVLVTFNLDYESDMDTALGCLNAAIESLQEDEEAQAMLLEKPTVLGWTAFTDWAIQAQIIAKVQPGQQWAMGRILRRAGMELLHKAGIRMAIPLQRIENLP